MLNSVKFNILVIAVVNNKDNLVGMVTVSSDQEVIYSSNSSIVSIRYNGEVYLNDPIKSDIVNISATINGLVLWRVLVVVGKESYTYVNPVVTVTEHSLGSSLF